LGVPDPDWGEIAVAFLSAAPDKEATAEEVAAFCKPILGFRTPKRFLFLPSLPKNANGKVDKNSLRQGLETSDAAP
jgi:acyl-CoA synthetase (AMP-forming)/AMP-acid ligase II